MTNADKIEILALLIHADHRADADRCIGQAVTLCALARPVAPCAVSGGLATGATVVRCTANAPSCQQQTSPAKPLPGLFIWRSSVARRPELAHNVLALFERRRARAGGQR
jgi:hypothetical protein